MSIFTVIVSRGLSFVGKGNGLPLGQVIGLRYGDKKSEYSKKKDQKDLFYWKSVELSDAESNEIFDALDHTIEPMQEINLNCFSAQEKTDLGKRGAIASKKGGNISKSNFIISNR